MIPVNYTAAAYICDCLLNFSSRNRSLSENTSNHKPHRKKICSIRNGSYIFIIVTNAYMGLVGIDNNVFIYLSTYNNYIVDFF